MLLSVPHLVFNSRRSYKLDVRIKFITVIQSLHGCKYINRAQGAGGGGLAELRMHPHEVIFGVCSASFDR